MYSLPSASQTCAPCAARDEARRAADGAKARTGEFTPPGMHLLGAREQRAGSRRFIVDSSGRVDRRMRIAAQASSRAASFAK